jgi:hypothetical protein
MKLLGRERREDAMKLGCERERWQGHIERRCEAGNTAGEEIGRR